MSRVNGRWALPPRAPFYAIPEGVLRYLAEHTTPLEERIMHRILAGWRWKDTGLCAVSINHLAKAANTDRRSAKKALIHLFNKGVIDFFEHGRGKKPDISIRPLINRVAASQRAAKMHKLTPERAKNGQLVAKMHKCLSPGCTSCTPSTCTSGEPGVVHPDGKNQNLQKRAGAATTDRGSAASARNDDEEATRERLLNELRNIEAIENANAEKAANA